MGSNSYKYVIDYFKRELDYLWYDYVLIIEFLMINWNYFHRQKKTMLIHIR